MPLAPPPEGESHASLEQLIRSVNQHAGPEGYAVVTARTKNSKLGVKRKAWLRCDRGGKSSGPKGQIRIHAASRRINCPFSLIAKRQDERWAFRVVNGAHSHDPTPPETHPALRRMALAEKKNNGGVVANSATNMNMNMNVNVNVQMIQSAGEEGEGEDGIPGSSILLDAGDKTAISGNYHHHHPVVEGIPQDSCRPKPAQMRSIEDDLLGRLEQALDPRIQNGGGGVLMPNHGVGGPESQGEDGGQDKESLDRGNTDTMDMDKNLEMMNLDMEHYKKATTTTAVGKATTIPEMPPSSRRKAAVQRRSQNRSATTTTQPSQQQQQQQQQVTDPTLSNRSFGINSSSS